MRLANVYTLRYLCGMKSKLTSNDKLRLRILQVRATGRLPRNIIPLYMDEYPEDDNARMRERVRNCWHLRVIDAEITSRFERLLILMTNS